MRISQQDIFQKKQQLQKEITEFETQLQKLVQEQTHIRDVQKCAESILRYNQLEKEIEDRTAIFSLLSSPPESYRSPYIKSQLFEYIEAAETVSVDLVDFIVTAVLEQLRKDIQSGEDDSVDLIQAEYKEYIIPGKIIAERFDEIDTLLAEMNRFCASLNPEYNPWDAQKVLAYGFNKSIDADTRMPPTIDALQKRKFEYMTPEDRAALLDHVNEHLAVLRYEEAKKQNIAMDNAIKMIEKANQ